MSRDLRLVSASLLLWGIGEGMFMYFLAIYLESLGATPVQIGGILGIAGAALAVTHLPAGALSDVVSRRTMMIASWALATVAAFMMFTADSLTLFSVGLVIYFMSSFVMAPLSSYIASGRGNWPAARALTTVYAGYSVGAIIGPLTGGMLAPRLGVQPLFGIAGVIFLFSTLLLLLIRAQPREASEPGQRYQALLRNGRLARFLPLAFLALFAMYLSWPLTPNYLQTTHDVSLSALGAFGSFNALGVVVLNLSLGRRSPGTALVISQLLVSISVLLFWRAAALPAFALAYFLAGAFRSARSLMIATVDGYVGRAELGMAFGLMETVGALVIIVGPPLAGVLYEVRPDLPYPVSLGLILIAAATTAVYVRRTRPAAVAVESVMVERIPGGE